MDKLVSTAAFWTAMCDDRFVRTGPYSGQIGSVHYFVLEPPEEIPGWMDEKLKQIERALGE